MLSCGIVGLPNVGKSTLFNALIKKQQALAANYPFATIEPNVGVVPVPDGRLGKLAQLVKAEEKMGSLPPLVPTMIKFVDIAGLVKGASQGEGLGNQFLSHIREVDAIVQVVRNFSDENVIRSGSTEPKSDIEVINTELILADLQTVQNSKIKVKSDKSKLKNVEFEAKASAMDKLDSSLNDGKSARDIVLTDDEKGAVKSLQLLTGKPIIYVLNSDEGKVAELSQGAKRLGGQEAVYVSAKLEAELSVLSEEEQKAYLAELNIKESGLDKVIRKAYEVLGLSTFLTAGPKEVRAWTTQHGSKAPQAAGVIHTDFERGFIAAEVISSEDLLSAGSFKVAKDLGKIRLEGREYVMKDGDVVEFRFSV
jgi:GTP-binding protein YchF